MIAYIEGELTQKEPTHAIIEAGGIGYYIRISLNTYSVIKGISGKCKLHTHLQIKEDAHSLFGFSDIIEKKVFQELISVSGIGPGTAMVMLSSMNASEVQQAIASEDLRTIQSIKGIGAKTAQRVILELKDKMKKDILIVDNQSPTYIHNTKRNEALSALVTLGIAKNVAEKNLEMIVKKEGENLSLEQLIKLALKMS
ncbi:MAG TPA: Holliday junction branch migration protein RuvA [Cytophagaceae bacterium]|jgi:Holliday junction DNA helicase RuvA|nr:Holliday junction branch migration protein RuvA [Cytophagaceae bacterium]